jgi:hypothetical protein
VALPKIRSAAPDLLRPAALLASAAVLAALLAVAVQRKYRGGAALAALSGGLVVVYLVIVIAILPALDPHKSARAFSGRVLARVGRASLVMYPDYHPTYVYYTGRFIPVLKDSRELGEYFASTERRYCLIEDDVFAVERRTLAGPPVVLDSQEIGHRNMLLIAGGGPPGDAVPEETRP